MQTDIVPTEAQREIAHKVLVVAPRYYTFQLCHGDFAFGPVWIWVMLVARLICEDAFGGIEPVVRVLSEHLEPCSCLLRERTVRRDEGADEEQKSADGCGYADRRPFHSEE